MTHYHVFETRLGFAAIAWSDNGITRFRLPYPDRASAQAQFNGKAKPQEPPPHVAAVVEQAVRYFAGEQIDFSPIELDLSTVDPLRRPIYDALRKVKFGETVSYGELAKRAGVTAPQAAQDVGVAMARNPVPLIIPCHRVLAAGGKLGGFSAPGRTETKEKMLALEGVFIGNQPRLL
ncbi:MAG: methylated-DNA-[protein]-cysteine S-methyltransferase [Hyphomicrobiales bacterium]|jgi:methylated-DNA-[protein]-cysteine S-methyltransferase|nr:methylated-DNA-[protein]-cysteine S-methyltransferase [Hyphomicrobiales bacterium]